MGRTVGIKFELNAAAPGVAHRIVLTLQAGLAGSLSRKAHTIVHVWTREIALAASLSLAFLRAAWRVAKQNR